MPWGNKREGVVTSLCTKNMKNEEKKDRKGEMEKKKDCPGCQKGLKEGRGNKERVIKSVS